MKYRPRYPIYIPSKGRFATCLTAKFLDKDGIDFRLVVEPQERDEYASRFGAERVVELPFSNLGLGSIPARNWIKADATAKDPSGRHWIVDDNIQYLARLNKGGRVPCESGPALAAMEDFVDRYENVALAGPNYWMFGIDRKMPPFYLNVHVYSCILVRNDLPFSWRGRYNEDTDLCLQVLSAGWCTVLFNAFLADKVTTMTMKGGNTDELYADDGRLKMARSLERAWPGVVSVTRKFRRPQHHVKDNWKQFDTPLKRRTDIDWTRIDGRNDYGLALREKRKA